MYPWLHLHQKPALGVVAGCVIVTSMYTVDAFVNILKKKTKANATEAKYDSQVYVLK